ncbi:MULTISPECIES: hypothetical protein [Sphingobacterium]|uniref:hypothetical protein n=1 Tax=Sphingobacterium TaxID=28453 RepID=UPI00257B29A5|nr:MULTISPECIES: hypothetical protein [Sphingobacterium]
MKSTSNTIEKTTMVSTAKGRALGVQTKVCQYLGWDAKQYCEHQSEQYEEFLEFMFKGFPEIMMNEVRYSSIMAGFWKNEWIIRNERDFLPLADEEMETKMEITKEGKLLVKEPDLISKSIVLNEYLYFNSGLTLVDDDYFMASYNETLKLIRNESRRAQTAGA